MAEDARIALLRNKLKLKLEARAQQADAIRKLRSAAMRGDSKAGKEFEAHLDKVMIETHKIDTSGNFPHKSPQIIAAKKLSAGDIATHAGANSGRVLHSPTAATAGPGKFVGQHYNSGLPGHLQARRQDTIERAATAKVVNLVAKHAGMSASERVKLAWVTRKKLHTYGKAGQAHP